MDSLLQHIILQDLNDLLDGDDFFGADDFFLDETTSFLVVFFPEGGVDERAFNMADCETLPDLVEACGSLKCRRHMWFSNRP